MIFTSCSTSASNDIGVENPNIVQDIGDFSGPVECSSSQGGGEDKHNLWLRGTHKMVIVMEYLTQLIGVLITLTRDASRATCFSTSFITFNIFLFISNFSLFSFND